MKYINPLNIFGRVFVWSDFDFDDINECQRYHCSICRWQNNPNCNNKIEVLADPLNHEIRTSCWHFDLNPIVQKAHVFFINQKYLPGLYDYKCIQTKNFIVFFWEKQKGKVILKFNKTGSPSIYYQLFSPNNGELCMTNSLENAFHMVTPSRFDLHTQCIKLYSR